LSSKPTYIGVAQQPETIRRVFVAARGQPHQLKVLHASRAGDAVAAEHHKFCAAIDAGQRRRIAGCSEPFGRGLAFVAIASGDDKGIAPGADFDGATPATRNVVWICLHHVHPP
jgi:hypothetical protein